MVNAPNETESPLGVGAPKGAGSLEGGLTSARDLHGVEAETGVNSDDRGPGAGDAAAQRPRPGSGLPCRNSNNSPQPTPETHPRKGYKLHRRGTYYSGQVGFAVRHTIKSTDATDTGGIDREGRAWELGEDGKTWERVMGCITGAERKRAFALRVNVEAFTSHHKHENCGFLTLTADSADMTPREFGRIWDDMRKTGRGHNRLKWLKGYVRVIEAQKRGAPHYHLCVATPYDLRPASFDWEALRGSYEARKAGDIPKAKELTKRYAQSAAPELREIWSELREVCAHYGLGRSEMLPFRKEAGAIAHYVGKYLEGGLSYRRDEWRGARRVEYDRTSSRDWKACASAFSWVSPGAKAWRERVGEMARAVGAADLDGLVKRLGSRWAYHVRPTIMMELEPTWRNLLQYWAEEYGGTVERKPMCTVGGKVLAWYPGSDEGKDCAHVFIEGDGQPLVMKSGPMWTWSGPGSGAK